MPETKLDAGSTPAETVRRFYAALTDGDGAALTALVASDFAEDAYLEWPRSLPYGGRVEGASRLGRLFGGMTGRPVTVGAVRTELRDVIDGGDRVVASLAFDYRPGGDAAAIPMRALELWTFRDDKVAGVEAFYWDTGALVAPVPS